MTDLLDVEALLEAALQNKDLPPIKAEESKEEKSPREKEDKESDKKNEDDSDRKHRSHRDRDRRSRDRDRHSRDRDRDRRRRTRSRSKSPHRRSRRRRTRSRSPGSRREGKERRESRHATRSLEPPDTDSSSRTVFVTNIPLRASKSDVIRFFEEKFGRVWDVRIIVDRYGKSKGVAYIEFYHKDSVAPALSYNAKPMMGQPIFFQETLAEKNLAVLAASEQPKQPTVKGATGALNSEFDDEEGRSHRKMDQKSRVLLMEKLQQSKGVTDLPIPVVHKPAPRQIPTPAPPPQPEAPKPEPPSPCIMLTNVFNPTEESEPGWDKEIAEDIKEECSKFGTVEHIFVDKDSNGFVYMKFATIPSAQAAVKKLDQRWFAGRLITAVFFKENTYYQRFPEANTR